MKRFLLYFIFVIVLIVTILPHKTYANTNRYATCDQCGLCADIIDDTPPMDQNDYVIKRSASFESWPVCMKCMYPDIDITDPSKWGNFESLKMIPDPENVANYIPNPPKKGRFYTGLGCFSTNLAEGFTEEGAASALTRPLLNVLLSLAGGIAFLYLLYGAFLVVTSRGDPEQLSQGRRTIYGAIIGVIFAMGSVFLINLIANGILKIPGF